MFKYLKESFKRKAARRRFRIYDHTITEYCFPEIGTVRYASWDNPLTMGKKITPEQYNYYKRFIKEGDLVVDIGANIGDTTVPMGLVAGKSGMVLGFECNPVIFKILKVNEGLNPDKTNIKAYPYAISEAEDEFYYNSTEASLSNGGISKEKKNIHGSFGLDQKVKSVNLEQFLTKNYPDWISKLSFLKTDTEGHDLIILKSLESLIKKTRPVLDAECFKLASREDRRDLFEMFDNLDYVLYNLDSFQGEDVSKPLNLEDFYRIKHFDFLALPNPVMLP